ncbi:hypothetical protein N431DRAFT_370578 [Stipitochalara longipes BDJ]|nr:hypothetical protein N431DRAFT_370578 [Stipitochalara longipes BDJ]
MANWKEKGVVPDSDDEEALDSQSTASGNEPSEERNNDSPSIGSAIEAHDIEPEGEREEGRNTKEKEKDLETSDSDAFATANEISEQFVSTLVPASELEKYSGSYDDGNDKVPYSSPHSPKVFKVPKVFWELEEAEDIPDQGDRSGDRPARGKSPNDEVSRSYVEITSPSSTLLSSVPASQLSLPPNTFFNRRGSSPLQDVNQKGPFSANTVGNNAQAMGVTTYAGRSLRQRNPIQLHPYVVEQEKYRQTLKARGIAPMRIAPSQEDSYQRARQSASPELDSQEKESQDVTDMGDSQSMDFNWDLLPSSSPLKPIENDAATDVESSGSTERQIEGEDDEDEEFPDIDELLSTHPPLGHLNVPKGRLKSYPTKSKLQVLSRAQSKRKGNLDRKTPSSNIYDAPASPPATSSPFPTTSRGFVSSKSNTKSRSLDQPPQTLSAQTSLNMERLADLPTPVTSAAKPMAVFVDSDSEDELAGGQVVSSSDESIQIRKVSKKIRGVLPASHLRLDYQQKKPQALSRNRPGSFSVSPVRTQPRRGVALPRNTVLVQSPSASSGLAFHFLSSDSDEDEEENKEGGFVFEDNLSSPLDSFFSQSRLGFAEEDDRIDAMLPSRKRLSTSSKTRQRKKSRIGTSTLSRGIVQAPTRQPKITEHLHRPRQSVPRARSSNKARQSVFVPGKQGDAKTSLSRKPSPPRLSILDVVGLHRQATQGVPQFIKIAARTARSKIGQGRQSPSRKFIRLANREDTSDALSVLEDWRGGRILPKLCKSPEEPFNQISAHPLIEIENNRQTMFQPPIPGLKQRGQFSNSGGAGLRRKLVISKGKQQSMNTFITREQGHTKNSNILLRQAHARPEDWRKERPRYVPPTARFAQLESSEIENSFQHRTSAFRSTKKTLDALYRSNRKRPVPQANLQLSRFLADEDVVCPVIEPKDTADSAKPKMDVASKSSGDYIPHKSRRKKMLPQRLDANAAIYQQPSDPLILEFLVPEVGSDIGVVDDRKLLGLAKFGTHYPINFDVIPLRTGIFFHEDTFIGSGRLAEAIGRTGDTHRGTVRPQTSFVLAGKAFSWGQWNEEVSSEIGLSFDWLADQLISESPPLLSPLPADATDAISFVFEYVHHHLSFGKSDDVKGFLCRMNEILQDFISRLESAAKTSKYADIRAWIETTSMSALILLELLRIARTEHEEPLAYQLEDLLKKLVTQSVKALLSQNLGRVRKLYDDLQYLSFREGGIKRDEFVVQGWVIIIKVLYAAHIPRGSFWDVLNPQLVETDIMDISDARMMEKLWYSMFSLLPLCEFDEFGVVIEGARLKASFDNWSLPQQLLKRVFALYHANQRQSPGFNDYCRAIVCRCHHLMVEWGWWHCSGIIGTLFDFFGSHNLAHLRNEEAYDSPRFLRELNAEPYLALEAEDRCFHIFLKVVALAIRHFRQVSDGKSIRNLVARLLPNHNRQYPKEESIHQRDLASLRNHHDLLCTLFWAAPSEYRPSPALIQELVVPDHSHKEACLINLRAWEQLTSFVLTHEANQETYQPLKLWYQGFFDSLVQQYLRVEGDIRDQARVLQGTNEQVLEERQLQDVIMKNRETIKMLVCTNVQVIASQIRDAQSSTGWIYAAYTLRLDQALDLLKVDTHSKASHALLYAYLEAINSYIDRVDEQAIITQDEDSRGQSTDEAVVTLGNTLLGLFRGLINHYLDATLHLSYTEGIPLASTLCEDLISCWARFVALVTDWSEDKLGGNALITKGFVGNGPFAVFTNRSTNVAAAYYWPYFLAKLLEHKKADVVSLYSLDRIFNFEVEWLLNLSTPKPSFEVQLTDQLQKRGFPLSAGISLNWTPSRKLQVAIRTMGLHLQALAEEMTFKSAETKAMYNFVLVEIMKKMQHHLVAMDPPTGEDYAAYLKSVQKIAAKIKHYGANICQLSRFFLIPSRHYRPPEDDPEFYTQGILNYCSHFGSRLKQTSFELFYYLIGGWKKALVSGPVKVRDHKRHIKRAMRQADFMLFLLDDFLPAILQAGFRHLLSREYMMYLAYFPNLAGEIGELLNGDEPLAGKVFKQVVNLLRIIMNCLLAKFEHTLELRFSFPTSDERSTRSMACLFWLDVTPHIENYTRRVGDEHSFQEVNLPFLRYLERMNDRLDPPHDRNFHRSAVAYRIPDGTSVPTGTENTPPESSDIGPDESKTDEDGTEVIESSAEVDNAPTPARRNGKTVSGRVRGNRLRQTEGLPPFVLAESFLENNVKLAGELVNESLAIVKGKEAITGTDELEVKIAAETNDLPADESGSGSSPIAKYGINFDIFQELAATLRAGLALRPPKNSNSNPIPRPITVLQCPADGGSYYLDAIVEKISEQLGADLIRLDSQDLAQLVGPYLDENVAWNLTRFSLLGFEAHRVAGKLEEYENEKEAQEEAEEAEEEEDPAQQFTRSAKVRESSKRIMSAIFTGLQPNSLRSNRPKMFGPFSISNPNAQLEGTFFDNKDSQQGKATAAPVYQSDVWDGLKVATAFDSVIGATDFKRARTSSKSEEEPAVANDQSRNIIIQLSDYKEMMRTLDGAELIGKLREAVNKKWKSGKNIILVGTTATINDDAEPALLKSEIQHLQSDIVGGQQRTIFVPPERGVGQDSAMDIDEKARLKRINLRHIEDMILKLSEGTQHLSPAVVDLEKDLDSATIFSEGLEDAVFTYARVHRIATTILGLEAYLSKVDGPLLSKALKILSASDEAKFLWGAEELKEEESQVEEVFTDSDAVQKKAKDKLTAIGKKCSRHEKKLLSGVVLPNDIKTTFDDIRAPKETIDAIKTLTTLSLLRPEAFSYGVLATDKIPGLLLYGPPGTGKTLLAKAVAKESGAIVLEVSGADLNDMFVGEGEKNVKAVFSLAKKLSADRPCVVFIDEADAIFTARGETKRTAHRELINQFLREWDGMNNLSAFIMVATNRPFDLDEAVLRRLPRRLLLDLPVEADREAILKIHLKSEILDESVSLSQLAKDTPFYSGSDLKNLSVAAALACIREENELAAKHTSEEPYTYPEKRLLAKAHFDKAMEEISASISEDMSTLTAIRKFDEKYGDRKGRRKKVAALGFGGTTIVEKDSEAARVRKMEA